MYLATPFCFPAKTPALHEMVSKLRAVMDLGKAPAKYYSFMELMAGSITANGLEKAIVDPGVFSPIAPSVSLNACKPSSNASTELKA